MSAPATKRIPAFVNALAKRAPEAIEALEADPRFELREAPPERLREMIKQEVAAGTRRILVSGGDGSLATAASALVGSATELALLPGGTLNHFARDHGVPDDLQAALECAATSTRTRCADVGHVNDHVFLNTSSVGAYVTFVRWRERLEPRWGYLLASGVAAVRLLGRVRPFALALGVGGEAHRYRTPLVFVGVGERELQLPSVGARVKDGGRGLHLFIIRGWARARLAALGVLASVTGRGALTSTSEVDSVLVDECTIDLPFSPANVAIDGEIVRLESPLRYRLLRDAVRVVTPE